MNDHAALIMFDLTKIMAWSVTAVLFPFVSPSCKTQEDEAGFWRNEREIIELAQRLKLGEYRLGLSGSGEEKELNDLKIQLAENESRLSKLNSDKLAAAAEIGRMETRNKEIGQLVLAQKRASAQGMQFETFPARDGRIFKNATVTVVDDSGVAFRHEHGAARLRYAELTDDQRLFFGLEESTALAAEDRERREALAYERSIDLELNAMREREELAASLEETNKTARLSSSLLSASSRQPEIRDLAQPAKPFGSGSTYRSYYNYSGYRSYRPVYRYVPRHPPMANPRGPAPRPRGPFQPGTRTFIPTNP